MDDVFPKAGDAAAKERVPGEANAPLSRRRDFGLGRATVRPSIRTVEGPGGSATAEPRVMRVLLALVDADGGVLSREDLLELCWDGRVVGDDAINRAVAEVRRIAQAVEAGFGVETIPRIGYRLTASVPLAEAAPPEVSAELPPPAARGFSRRWALGGAVAAAGLGALGTWAVLRPRTDPRLAELVDRGQRALRSDVPGSDAQAVALFRRAVALAPEDPAVHGLLAWACYEAAEELPLQQVAGAVQASERAAARSLKLDPEQPDALFAMAMLKTRLDERVTTEDKLAAILKLAPDHLGAIGRLAVMLQAVGRSRDSWDYNERAAALEPLLPGPQFKKALKYWIFGRTREADGIIDRARELWPRDSWVWNARLLILAFTGRPHAALVMVEDAQNRPPSLSQPAVEAWRASLKALESGAARDIAAARETVLALAPQGAGIAASGIMQMSALGELDAAFALAEGLMLRRGRFVAPQTAGEMNSLVASQSWRRTQWLFIPATDRFRADPRFGALCEGVGLTAYWRRRGIWPDRFQLGSLRPDPGAKVG